MFCLDVNAKVKIQEGSTACECNRVRNVCKIGFASVIISSTDEDVM